MTRYMVASFGGVRTSGRPNEQWFWTLVPARDEIKRRLQVRKLHRRAREGGRDFGTVERTWTHEGLEWRVVFSIDYCAVTRSHMDFNRSGGCTLYELRAETEAKRFVNPFKS
jgi:hypothetical protein